MAIISINSENPALVQDSLSSFFEGFWAKGVVELNVSSNGGAKGQMVGFSWDN